MVLADGDLFASGFFVEAGLYGAVGLGAFGCSAGVVFDGAMGLFVIEGNLSGQSLAGHPNVVHSKLYRPSRHID